MNSLEVVKGHQLFFVRFTGFEAQDIAPVRLAFREVEVPRQPTLSLVNREDVFAYLAP